MAWKPLNDLQWEFIKPLIPEQHMGRPRSRDREILDAIIYVLTTGIQWDNLPKEFPPKSTVHRRFQIWRKAGFFRKLFRKASHLVDNDTVQHLDTTIRQAKKGGRKSLKRAG